MADTEFTIRVTTALADDDEPAALTLRSGAPAHAGIGSIDEVDFGFAADRA